MHKVIQIFLAMPSQSNALTSIQGNNKTGWNVTGPVIRNHYASPLWSRVLIRPVVLARLTLMVEETPYFVSKQNPVS
jgi:hypothetical protein